MTSLLQGPPPTCMKPFSYFPLPSPVPHALHLQDALQPSRSGVFNKKGIQKFLQGIQGLVVKRLWTGRRQSCCELPVQPPASDTRPLGASRRRTEPLSAPRTASSSRHPWGHLGGGQRLSAPSIASSPRYPRGHLGGRQSF